MNVQKARYTAGRLGQTFGPVAKDALAVSEKSCVNAILWKRFVLMLLLILTSRRMVSVPLKSQVQHTQSTTGCQMSLEPRSALWLSAHRIQGSNAKQLLEASDICNSSQQCVCCVIILRSCARVAAGLLSGVCKHTNVVVVALRVVQISYLLHTLLASDLLTPACPCGK